MARRVVAYACQWGCRRKVIMRRADMILHESSCCYNPVAKACITCGNFWPRDEDGDHGCEVEVDLTEGLTRDCDQWKPKEPPVELPF